MKTLLATPCFDTLQTAFVISLGQLIPANDYEQRFLTNTLIYDARNQLAQYAIDNGFDRILWLDSDMVFEPDLFVSLSETLENEDADLVTALCFSRRAPNYRPCIYTKIGYQLDPEREVLDVVADTYWDYPEDSVFPVAACGMAACIMKVDMVKEIRNKKGLPFSPEPGFGEDLSFCKKAGTMGYKMLCDSRIKVGHIGTVVVDETMYKAVRHGSD